MLSLLHTTGGRAATSFHFAFCHGVEMIDLDCNGNDNYYTYSREHSEQGVNPKSIHDRVLNQFLNRSS